MSFPVIKVVIFSVVFERSCEGQNHFIVVQIYDLQETFFLHFFFLFHTACIQSESSLLVSAFRIFPNHAAGDFFSQDYSVSSQEAKWQSHSWPKRSARFEVRKLMLFFLFCLAALIKELCFFTWNLKCSSSLRCSFIFFRNCTLGLISWHTIFFYASHCCIRHEPYSFVLSSPTNGKYCEKATKCFKWNALLI